MPGVKAILPTLRRRLSTGDIFKPARKLVKLSLHIRKDFITRVASKNVWVILAPSNGLIAIMNWFQKVSLNEMSGKVLTSQDSTRLIAIFTYDRGYFHAIIHYRKNTMIKKRRKRMKKYVVCLLAIPLLLQVSAGGSAEPAPDLVIPLATNDSGKVRIQTASRDLDYPYNTYVISSID